MFLTRARANKASPLIISILYSFVYKTSIIITVQVKICKKQTITVVKNNKEKGIEICNSLNCEYRWLRFYVDDDCDVVVSIDAVLGEDSYLDDACGEMCMFYLKRVISILDEAYPQIAKARWA